MIDLKKGYDSEAHKEILFCDFCSGEILPPEVRVICGTGNSMAASYHLRCYRTIEKLVPYRVSPPRNTSASKGTA